jgi:hypothetical protein
MDPQQDQQLLQNDQPQPIPTPPSLQPTEQPLPKAPQISQKKSHKKLALTLLIGPTVLLIFAFILFAILNSINSAAHPAANSGELFGESNPVVTIINVLLFLLGTVGVLSWLPGIIIGAILLSKK